MPLGVFVKADPSLALLPREVGTRTAQLSVLVAELLAARVRYHIGSRSGKMASSVSVLAHRRSTGAGATIESSHPGVLAQQYGAFIKPRRGSVLRFEIGDRTIYTRGPVRIPAKRFVEKSLAESEALIVVGERVAFNGL